ncbi:3-phosphoshikimate 1-carboxyvinyltransferase [Haloimpatiens sp. FM7330]|uniref:3-phosphoshikimate 1-carboxyvinyltransferase n=1 Tax=Haloimpatiens sp. FM7330 TaxID=3298610 RepID=UPI0036322A20
MKYLKINPSSLCGKIKIPPSKSMSHRAVICAGLSEEKSVIDDIIFSQDIIATCEAMKALGISIDIVEKNLQDYKKIYIEGRKKLKLINNSIDCKESGSTLRFLIPIALLTGDKITFKGSGKLVERPLNVYYEIFDKQGIEYSNHNGNLPLEVKGSLSHGEYKVKGNISSQFISGLLFTLPLLKGDSKIIITTELESKAYIDLTLQMLKTFNIEIENNNYEEFYIKGNQKYISKDYKVEGDFSQAAFWLVGGIIGEKISCCNLEMDSLQGDKVILDIIKKMGGNIKIKEDFVEVSKSQTKGIVIDASQCPDLVPILAVLGSVSDGTTKIINAERLRIKECDRLKAITNELKILGANIEELEDGLVIQGRKTLNGGVVDSWNDHRIAMALAVASIKCTESVIIKGSNAVSKSYPQFWNDFKKLGGNIHECCVGK